MDTNGILNVTAKDTSSGKEKNITIKNDKGRLSQQDIDRMVEEAEKYKEEDDRQRERIAARNQLEAYVFNVKQAVDEAGSKLSDTDKNTVRKECDECLKWLDQNTLAEKEEYEEKQKYLTFICSQIMAKLYTGGRQQQMPQNCGQEAGAFHNTQNGPTIKEVD